MKIEEDGDHSANEYSCRYAPNRAQHRKQIRSFVLKKPIKWSANRFFVAMLGDDRTLLVKAQTKEILENSGIKGIYWLDVLDKRGERYEDTFQLKVRKSALNPAVDIAQTEAILGEGFAKPAILVSKRFYETVVGNGLGKTLHFEPIILEE